jgi:hypothetical protein
MRCLVVINRYPKYLAIFGFLSMAFFSFFLMFNKKYSFYKLMGCGKNGTFDIKPDFNQWALLLVANTPQFTTNIVANDTYMQSLLPNFITKYIQFFNCSTTYILLNPFAGHGFWDGKQCFGNLQPQNIAQGQIAVLTRATIRPSKLVAFWKHVPLVAQQMDTAKGLIVSYGIGEVPFIKQATLSIWQDIDSMKEFAYKMKEHQQVIKKTKKDNWYSEDMFVRFTIIYRTL